MRTFLFVLAGILSGLVAAFILVLVAGWVVPLFLEGGGRDAMSQGIMATIVFTFSAPVLSLIGGIIAYRKAKKPLSPDT